jgi:transcriptional regulator GlxA family with amidase domain
MTVLTRVGAVLCLALLFVACQPTEEASPTRPDAPRIEQALAHDSILTAGVVALDQVYNTELVAPYDVLEHTYYRDSTRFVAPFVVSPDGDPVTTFEGIEVAAHYSFDDAPPIDVLVVPSTGNSLDADLQNERFLRWLGETARAAEYVVSVCYGGLPLAATGVLDGRQATTFPSAQDQMAEQFPAVTVRRDVRFVVDGTYVTSVGGARSYEPALYLVDRLYGTETARSIADGLVLPWDLEAIPHAVAP